MSDVVKWALLAAAAVALIALIVALPVAEFVNPTEFGNMIGRLVTLVGDFFQDARGLINNFLTPFGRTVLTGLLAWLFGKMFITLAIKIGAWIYHFIFRG